VGARRGINGAEMANSLHGVIRERRKLLQNPYAYIEELEEMAALHETRRLHENPYRDVDKLNRINGPVARFDGLAQTPAGISPKPAQRRYSDDEIERIARKLQRDMWARHGDIVPGAVACNPFDMLDAAAALQFLGYEVDLAETLGQVRDGNSVIEIAGTIDKPARRVCVSRRYPPRVRSFTTAHELGHAMMHESAGMHRDRPVEGIAPGRDAQEYEADRFATYFLMPGKLVRTVFESIFGAAPFELNDDTRFALSAALPAGALPRIRTRRDLSSVLASAARYNGRDIVPLAEQFRVSRRAMAIRLEELDLVHF
jgi:Zn-dependent peptidase ImmA (M78 family)